MINGPKFPCMSDKRPASGNGFYSAQRDLDDSAWELVGIPTGAVSGFDVLDVDVEGLDWLTQARLPPTRVQVTRSGGRHLFFKHVDGMRCSAGRIAPGVDVRADGGYIIDWSREGFPVEDREIAEWPEDLLRLALKPNPHPSAPCKSSRGTGDGDQVLSHGADRSDGLAPTRDLRTRSKNIIRKIEYAKVGERNRLLNWGAYVFGQIIAEGKIKVEIAELLLEGAAKVNGLWHDDGASQCRATIRSGIRSGVRDWNDLTKRRF